MIFGALLNSREAMPEVRKYQLLPTSFSYQARNFFGNSALHGVRYITENGRPCFEKLLWACCTAVGATVAMIIIISVWEKFQNNPTITGLDTNFHNWDVPFPGISLCQDDPIDMQRIDELIIRKYNHVEPKKELREYLRAIGLFSRRNLGNLDKFQDYKDFPFTNFKEIAADVVNRCENVMSNCSFKGSERACCNDMLFPILTENGFCYTFNVDKNQGAFMWNNSEYKFQDEYIYETDPKWSFEFHMANTSTNPVYIFIHASNEHPTRDIKVHHTWSGRIEKISFSVKTTYTTTETRQLSMKQRRCVFPDEIKVLGNQEYTYSGCMRECRIKKALEQCGCVPFIYSGMVGNNVCDFDGLRCYVRNEKTILTVSGCSCELSCETSVYEVEKLTESVLSDQGMEISFVSWPVIRYKREVLFGWADLLVSFGGIAGLFLGFSLLAGVETIYYFTMRACCMVYKESDTLARIKKEYEEEDEKPILDLSLTPYFMKKEQKTKTIVPRVHHIRAFDENPQKRVLF